MALKYVVATKTDNAIVVCACWAHLHCLAGTCKIAISLNNDIFVFRFFLPWYYDMMP